ncbi:MAG: gfo/Idh/MocA family oxidoreductase [Puniceicoccaceae bacterium]|nr:MAG: gfo/Idh/MocA family oxidoreductase [Puniceicoccaceae bacterium]
MTETTSKLRAVLAGCGRMGGSQARLLADHPDYELVAVQDIFPEAAEKLAAELGVRPYTSLEEMLGKEKPDTVSVTSANSSHAPITLAAAEAGVRGIYCEKPIAVHLADARAMHEACQRRGIPLIINHQRRTGPDLLEARRLVESGALGEIRLMRGDCAGDLLSDGTHLIDSLLFLAGEVPVKTAWGTVYRSHWKAPDASAGGTGFDVGEGTRFGHVVEEAATGVLFLENQLRIEVYCGQLHDRRRAYHDLEIIGTRGRLWRTGDKTGENLFLDDGEPGDHEAAVVEGQYRCVPAAEGRGRWKSLFLERPAPRQLIADAYAALAKIIREGGGDHPMSSAHALPVHEALSALYESARIRSMVTLPLTQDRFPLDLMLEPAASAG